MHAFRLPSLPLSLSLYLFHLLKSRMEAVEGVALYSSSGVLFGMWTSSDVDKLARQHHFQTEFEKLRKLQVRIVGVLNDAEKNQVSKPSVKTWLDNKNKEIGFKLDTFLINRM
ncbi:hypothetical protein VitviT2T_026767 [Vitis vinifera]|uniref:Rx N-terminal domain-containing protein n=1 Tax=Vitis vinifera TaxID=29760 RepID=A0ABY9DQR2_VITVI|nr:hypothetical protein VitviT2T_026767 [Vitis vinifera]